MRKIEGGKPLLVLLGTEERMMLGEMANEDMRNSNSDMIRVLIRREYLRRKAAKYEAQAERVQA